MPAQGLLMKLNSFSNSLCGVESYDIMLVRRQAAEAMQHLRQHLMCAFSHCQSPMCGHAGESEPATGWTTFQDLGWRPAAFFFFQS